MKFEILPSLGLAIITILCFSQSSLGSYQCPIVNSSYDALYTKLIGLKSAINGLKKCGGIGAQVQNISNSVASMMSTQGSHESSMMLNGSISNLLQNNSYSEIFDQCKNSPRSAADFFITLTDTLNAFAPFFLLSSGTGGGGALFAILGLNAIRSFLITYKNSQIDLSTLEKEKLFRTTACRLNDARNQIHSLQRQHILYLHTGRSAGLDQLDQKISLLNRDIQRLTALKKKAPTPKLAFTKEYLARKRGTDKTQIEKFEKLTALALIQEIYQRDFDYFENTIITFMKDNGKLRTSDLPNIVFDSKISSQKICRAMNSLYDKNLGRKQIADGAEFFNSNLALLDLKEAPPLPGQCDQCIKMAQ